MAGSYILVVDDDESIRLLLQGVLEDEGHAVRLAEDGRKALALVDDERPALVLLDMRMPVMDGWEFNRRLRETDARLPVVVMTAARDARQWAEEIHAQGYIAKPFDVDELCSLVEGFVER